MSYATESGVHPVRLAVPWGACWAGALLALAWGLAAVGYASADPDSALYAQLAARMSGQPLRGWIAPGWGGLWGTEGLFREHPAGLLWLPALLGRLGYPAAQAAYLINALYQVGSLLALQRLAARFASRSEARALGWALQLLPLAFTYRVRANHEQAVLLCFAAALWAADAASEAQRRWWLAGLALGGLALVKGLLVLGGLGACAALLWARGRLRDRRALLGLGQAALVVLALALAYEAAYRAATGEPFWSWYAARQVGVALLPGQQPWALRKALNLGWYLGRAAYYTAPFGLAALWACARSARARAEPGLRLAVAVALGYWVALALFDRRADRYAFPADVLLAAAGAVACLRAWPRLRGWAHALGRWGEPGQAGLWLGLALLQVVSARLGLHRLHL